MSTDNETIGAVIGGMIAWDHAIQNRLTDSHLDEAIDWAKRFRDLYDDVKRHNRDIYVQEALWEYENWRRSIPGKIEHYESMKMGQPASNEEEWSFPGVVKTWPVAGDK